MTGRARGRGVARGRAAPASAGVDAARRPGSGPTPQQPPPPVSQNTSQQRVPVQVTLIQFFVWVCVSNEK